MSHSLMCSIPASVDGQRSPACHPQLIMLTCRRRNARASSTATHRTAESQTHHQGPYRHARSLNDSTLVTKAFTGWRLTTSLRVGDLERIRQCPANTKQHRRCLNSSIHEFQSTRAAYACFTCHTHRSTGRSHREHHSPDVFLDVKGAVGAIHESVRRFGDEVQFSVFVKRPAAAIADEQ